jgi:hypothetical protein
MGGVLPVPSPCADPAQPFPLARRYRRQMAGEAGPQRLVLAGRALAAGESGGLVGEQAQLAVDLPGVQQRLHQLPGGLDGGDLGGEVVSQVLTARNPARGDLSMAVGAPRAAQYGIRINPAAISCVSRPSQRSGVSTTDSRGVCLEGLGPAPPGEVPPVLGGAVETRLGRSPLPMPHLCATTQEYTKAVRPNGNQSPRLRPAAASGSRRAPGGVRRSVSPTEVGVTSASQR